MVAGFIIYGLFIAVLLIYLLYPLWLVITANPFHANANAEIADVDVTVVLLSFNGGDFVKPKVKFLLNEISKFRNGELILIDDCSKDGSIDSIAREIENKRLKIIKKCEHKGIPDSMNASVKASNYNNIVFCDQRQEISPGAISILITELCRQDIGAVSSCISHISRDNCSSWIRKYENIIKKLESESGSVIGVYGPLFAIRKDLFTDIPNNIILDDLYLSLNILGKSKIAFVSNCLIHDDNVNTLFDYQRVRRYLLGFFQIFSDKLLMKRLSGKHITMLMWHKYIRLIIPILLVASFTLTGIYALTSIWFAIAFIIVLLILAYSFIGVVPQFALTNMLRINMYYFLAMFDLLFNLKTPNRNKSKL